MLQGALDAGARARADLDADMCTHKPAVKAQDHEGQGRPHREACVLLGHAPPLDRE